MEYINLGNTGLKVSKLCLGTMTFSNQKDLVKNSWGFNMQNEKDSHAMLDEFIEQGGNFIDTADAYGPEYSEICIGNWMKKRAQRDPQFRSKIVIATKVYNSMGPSPNNMGLSRAHIFDAIEGSLKRLQTPYVDLYQCHLWDDTTPLEETLAALNDLVRAGKVHYVGISNYTGWQLQKALDICKMHNYANIVTAQMMYHLLNRNIEWEFSGIRSYENISIMAWSPLAGGFLTNKMKRNYKPEEGSRLEWATKAHWRATDMSYAEDEQTWKILAVCEAIGKKYNCGVAEVALAWLVSKKAIPIVGASNMDQLKTNLKAAHLHLTAEDVEQLDKASAQELPYPYSLITGRN